MFDDQLIAGIRDLRESMTDARRAQLDIRVTMLFVICHQYNLAPSSWPPTIQAMSEDLYLRLFGVVMTLEPTFALGALRED